MEVLDRTASQPVIDWLYLQPVATMMWLRKGISRFDLGLAGTARRSNVVAGDTILYIPPGMDAQGEFAVADACSYVAVFFPAELAEHAANQPLIGFDDPAMRAGLTDLRGWVGDPSFALMAEGWALQTAARLRRRSLDICPDPGSVPEFDSSRLIEYLRYGGSTPTLAEMAKAAALSRHELMHALWKRIKQTPFEYALKVRMEAAADLLRDPRTPIETIAALYGYETVAKFSTAFQRALGTTPKRHRASTASSS